MPTALLHTFLAVITTVVLASAGIQAFLLAFQDRQLHQKTQSRWLVYFPSLEKMETVLFQIVGGGFVLLTLLLVSSFYFYQVTVWSYFFSKTVLTCVAWLVFAVLMLGRRLLGWRGRKAVYGTVIGVGLVLVLCVGAYFHSMS